MTHKERVRGQREYLPTYEEVSKELRVNEKGQLFFTQVRPGRSIDKPAGHWRKDGYVSVRLFGQRYLAHRIVWLLSTKNWPTEQLDHINGNRRDNRKENLREITVAQNRLNVKTARNASGVVGVTWAKKEGNWRASININGKGVNLGHFASLEMAIKCRKAAEAKYGYLIPAAS